MTDGPPGFALVAGAGERLVFGPVTILVRASAETTGGAFSLFEELPPMVDTRLHVHEYEDELFYVLEGDHVFRRGEEEFPLGPGGLIFSLLQQIRHHLARVTAGPTR